WGEMSYDFKLMFFYHGSMMVILIIGRALSVVVEVMIATALLAMGILLGIKHRRTTSWTWPGLTSSRLLGATATALLGGLFLAAATPLFPPTHPGLLPWYLAGLGIITFAVLSVLGLVSLVEIDYFTPQTLLQSVEVPWRKILRLMYSIFFLVVWLEGVASFYYFGITFRGGSVTADSVR